MTASSYAEAKTEEIHGETSSPLQKAGYHGGGTVVDANSGDMLVFVEDKQPPAPLTVYRSQDDGKSWQAQTTTIEKDENGNTPSMHMNEHGVTLLRGPTQRTPHSPLTLLRPQRRRCGMALTIHQRNLQRRRRQVLEDQQALSRKRNR